ncbi:MAG: BMP family ABC transporter substrate-binding protein, partial [Actinomycetota bacterium]|nr:BMP family ABC transporter substrate-binding protein [Actinomycetota bacterium]
MRKTARFAAVAMAAALTLSACGSDEGTDEGTDTGDAPTSDIKVGMAYDVGGRGDQSFNDSAAAGLDQAVEEFGMEPQESEAEDGEAESAREERLRTFADAGYDPIIAVGFAYAA